MYPHGGLSAVFLAQRPILFRLFVARLGSPEEAEDALQELWLRLLKAEDRPVENAAAYVLRAAANLATERRRSAVRLTKLETEWAESRMLLESPPSVEQRLLLQQRLQRAQRVFDAMPARTRTAFFMFRCEGISQRDIADRLGISLSGVEKLLRRAYRQFEALAAEEESDADT